MPAHEKQRVDRETTLAGRQRELEILHAHTDALLSGRGAVVLISGDAGVGKSALIAEIARDAGAAGAVVLSGGCYDLTTTPPYGPWLEVARTYRRGQDGVMPPASLSSAGMTEVGSQAALFDEVARFLSDLAGQQPLMLVLEDLHWSDPASADLLRVIARQAASIPLLVLATYRSAELSREGPLYQLLPLIVRESRAERIDLQPLDQPAVAALVASRYSLPAGDHERLVSYLMRSAEGNPFYIQELLRGLEGERLLVRDGAMWRLGDVVRMRVPALLRQVVDNRLARLDARTQEQVTVASVIGQDVLLDLWQAVLGVSDDDLLDTVDRAAREQLIEPSPDGLSIRFRHALIRSALYQLVLPPRRRSLHRAVADILIGTPDPDPDAVAWHLQQAHDDRAAAWLIRAGERAQRAYAWTTAAERLIDAEDRLPASTPTSERGWLLYRIGRLRRHADSGNAVRWLQEAERLGMLADDPVLTAYASFDLGHIQVLSGDFVQGLDRMLSSDRLLDELPPDHALPGSDIAAWVADALPCDARTRHGAVPLDGLRGNVTRHGTLCQWLVEPGRLSEAASLAEPFVAAVARIDAPDEQTLSSAGDAWFGLGRVAAAMADPARARAALDRAVDCYRRINHHLLIAGTTRVILTEVVIPYDTTNVAGRRRIASASEEAYRQAVGALPAHLTPRFASLELMLLEGDWDEAVALLEPMTGQTSAMVTWRHRAIALLGRLACDRGDDERAWECVRLLLPGGPHTEPGTTTFNRAIDLHLVAVDLSLHAGDTLHARAWLESLDRWLEWSGARRWRPESRLGWAGLLLSTGDVIEAYAHAVAARDDAEQPRQPLALVAAYRMLGRIEMARGRSVDAGEHLSASLALADACDAPFERAQTLVSLAEASLSDRGVALSMLEEARDVFERLSARRALERTAGLQDTLARDSEGTGSSLGLSKRELEVLRLVAQGMTDAQIADQLFISYRTVTTHLSSIFNKLGVSSRVSATRIAVEHDLL